MEVRDEVIELHQKGKIAIRSRFKTDSFLNEIMAQADNVIATTGAPELIKQEMVRKGQIILALSNPRPEIDPELAKAAAETIADLAPEGELVPNPLDTEVH